ncbi:MAG TPA: hypothetical protein VKZ53_21860 [Candidatus Angelobacter sp.]|nr:hypothetical protein [Candidatus Angelobacter sp.]
MRGQHGKDRSALAFTFAAMVLVTAFLGGRAEAQNIDQILDGSFHSMYNLQFDDALQRAEAAKSIDKDDPLPWVTQACAVLFREFDRLHILRSDLFASDDAFVARPAYSWTPSNKKAFDDATDGAEKIAKMRLARDKNDAKALFVLALVNGLRGDDSAMITKHNLAALSYIKTATGYSDRLLALSPDYYDAYVGTGMGKYIIGGRAAPVRWLLRIGGFRGDQEEGVRELTLAAEHGRFLAPFARIFLAFNDLRHKNRAEAKRKLAELHQQFPGNPLFLEEIAKCDNPSSGQ